MRILITDGNNRATLAITRSLGSQHHDIFVGAKEHPSLASSSRYCKAQIIYADPVNDPDTFVDDIAQAITNNKIDMLIPVSDVTTMLVAEHRHSHFSNCILPIPELDSLKKAADKSYITRYANSIGISVPKSIIINSASELIEHAEKISYPVVIKPARSRVLHNNSWIFTSVNYADDAKQLSEILNNKHPAEFPVLLQERITGPGVGIFLCYANNKVYAHFSHRRIREKPPSGGVSVLRESIAVNEQASILSEKLLNHLNWYGVAMIEYKLDTRDNTLKLMEINGRFWGSLQLAIDSGVDFPAILINLASGNTDIKPVLDYKLGVKTRWLCGDIDALLLLLLKSRESLKLPTGHPGRLKTLINFCKFWQKDMHYEVLQVRDIKPWFFELKKWVKGN